MIGQFLRTREMRKFRRSRTALVAFAVCCLYLAVGLSILLFGLIDLDATERRVGTDNMPGFFRKDTLEKRFEAVDRYLTSFERVLKKRSDEALDGWSTFAYRELRVDREELSELVDDCLEIYGELEEEENLDAAPDEFEPKIEEMEAIVASAFVAPTGLDRFLARARLALGTDRQGRSILVRGLYSTKVAVQMGVVTALVSVLFGSLLGAAAAFFGGIVDWLVIWLYSTMSSIPNLVLLTVLAFMFTGSRVEETLIPVYVAFCLTFWIGPCRVTRGETLKLKELEYVQAATAIGFSRFYIMFKHIVPNTAHLLFVNFSLIFVAAIKFEVILSFLDLGVKKGPSWGIMINHAKPEVINGFFWQIGTATFLMFGLVLAFNILTDSLQDAFDPKHV